MAETNKSNDQQISCCYLLLRYLQYENNSIESFNNFQSFGLIDDLRVEHVSYGIEFEDDLLEPQLIG